MPRFEIANPQSGFSFGVYEDATAEQALDACYREAGYDSAADYVASTDGAAELVAYEVA